MNIDEPKTSELNAPSLPIWKLLAFTLAGFLTIMTETMPAGLLPQISESLGVSKALAGQLITFYALGSVLAAIPVIAATRSWNRRRLFLLAIGSLLVFNIVTALSSSYAIIIAARFAAGMAAGVIWGLLPGYVLRMVADNMRGRALAITGVGQPIALAFGVPLGTWLGLLLDWRGVFWIMSALTLLSLIWVRLALPDFAGQSAKQRLSIRHVFSMPGIRPVLLTLFVWIAAHNILYTYIEPFLASVGLAQRVDAILLLFGIAAIVGIWLTGLLVDNWLRLMALISLSVFAIGALVLGFSGGSTAIVLVGIAIWGLTFGGAPILLQTALAGAAGDNADVAQSMLVTVFNLAIACGGVAGAILLQRIGAVSFPWAVLALALLGLSVVWSARRNGFVSS
ncbi:MULTISPECIES: MFS transporter [Psychrobacter]|mgnify:CR=1 FL=1|uniref:Transporter, major facilitator family protein n=1 Tax=Psychrobacter alimentarius TaxID=261164 RepID=A0ABM5ZUG4_9GAMM|nr:MULTISPECIES: MFS transporter [Psychrobacter]AMT95698.1 Transporter, major facilitator family protein [Psychrobacter alimentarius]QCB31866.1 MFS transporter [Psychrobacter sp. PAMC27889]